MLRVVGDVHGQIEPDDIVTRGKRSYLELIAGAPFSVQVGDMGDAESYRQLTAKVDPTRHRFFAGNHDHHGHFPAHCLGDFGLERLDDVEFFFVRGASSVDRAQLQRVGRELGRKLWFEEEELDEQQMAAVEQAYKAARPSVVITHDAPSEIARLAWENAQRHRTPVPGMTFDRSRTNALLSRLLESHPPKVWLFGHHHHSWMAREGTTQFICVGQLEAVEIDAAGNRSGI